MTMTIVSVFQYTLVAQKIILMHFIKTFTQQTNVCCFLRRVISAKYQIQYINFIENNPNLIQNRLLSLITKCFQSFSMDLYKFIFATNIPEKSVCLKEQQILQKSNFQGVIPIYQIQPVVIHYCFLRDQKLPQKNSFSILAVKSWQQRKPEGVDVMGIFRWHISIRKLSKKFEQYNIIQKVCLNDFVISENLFVINVYSEHYKDIIQITDFSEYIKQKSNGCEELITNIQQQMDKAQLLFNKLKKKSKYKYQLNEGKFENLSFPQNTQALEEYLKLNELKDEISKLICQSVFNFYSVVDEIYSSLFLQIKCILFIQQVNFDDKIQNKSYQSKVILQNLNEALTRINKALEVNPDQVNSLQTKGECFSII